MDVKMKKRYLILALLSVFLWTGTVFADGFWLDNRQPYIAIEEIETIDFNKLARKTAAVELDSDTDGYIDIDYMPLDELWTFTAGVTISTTKALTLGTT